MNSTHYYRIIIFINMTTVTQRVFTVHHNKYTQDWHFAVFSVIYTMTPFTNVN